MFLLIIQKRYQVHTTSSSKRNGTNQIRD